VPPTEKFSKNLLIYTCNAVLENLLESERQSNIGIHTSEVREDLQKELNRAATYLLLAMEKLSKSQKAWLAEPLVSWVASLAGILAVKLNQYGQGLLAKRILDSAIEATPSDADLHAIRGQMILKNHASDAIGDLEIAVKQNSKIPFPYIYLAHRALREKRYAESLDLCEKAIARSFNDSLDEKANLLEWSAIAAAELGHPAQEVAARFKSAMKYAPGNSRIQKNYESFLKSNPHQLHSTVWDSQPILDESEYSLNAPALPFSLIGGSSNVGV
jgi:hypothetical protein